MLACVLFVQEWRIEFELKREVGALCHPALCHPHPTTHNIPSPTRPTPAPSPLCRPYGYGIIAVPGGLEMSDKLRYE
jgi:hypothetical protein